MDPEKELDDIGWKLLYELQVDGRASYTELGRRLSLTPPAVAERVRRLEDAGIITGYSAQIDMARIGLPITAYVRIRGRAEYTSAQISALAVQMPEVLESHRVTGEDVCVLRIAVQSVQHLQAVIDRLGRYGDTTTSIVLSSPLERRILARPEPDDPSSLPGT